MMPFKIILKVMVSMKMATKYRMLSFKSTWTQNLLDVALTYKNKLYPR